MLEAIWFLYKVPVICAGILVLLAILVVLGLLVWNPDRGKAGSRPPEWDDADISDEFVKDLDYPTFSRLAGRRGGRKAVLTINSEQETLPEHIPYYEEVTSRLNDIIRGAEKYAQGQKGHFPRKLETELDNLIVEQIRFYPLLADDDSLSGVEIMFAATYSGKIWYCDYQNGKFGNLAILGQPKPGR